MEEPADIDVRCSVAAFKAGRVLLVHRTRDGADDWVLPGGTPRPGESMFSCARRETMEETGLRVEPGRVAFVLESFGPDDLRRAVDLVFLAGLPKRSEPVCAEEGFAPEFVAVDDLPRLPLRPPIAGHLRALHARGSTRTAAYLGNLWRPDGGNGTSPVREPARDGIGE